MSDVEVADSPLEELQAKHRKEKKELKDKCLALKKAAKCGNKQKQKDTNAEIEEMEKVIERRHAEELDELSKQVAKTSISEPIKFEEKKTEEPTEDATFYKSGNVSSKSKKKQAKKAEASEKMRAAMKEDQENALNSMKTIESTALLQVLADRGLQLVDIRPDGDCLYNSIAHQLNRTSSSSQVGGKDIRRRAARFMLEQRDDFVPFITNDEGDPLDEFEYESYCSKVESEAKDGGVWGGEPELIAISRSLERKIEVIQPEGRCITYGEDYSTRPLTIVYQRHAYSLGEHYNSTEPRRIV